jgi:hypothetical protein
MSGRRFLDGVMVRVPTMRILASHVVVRAAENPL